MIEYALFTIDVIPSLYISDVQEFDLNDVEYDDIYVPTQKELENQEKAYELIKEFQKDHPAIKHSHQYVTAPLNHTSELEELWILLKNNGIYCDYFGRLDDGHAFVMDFRKSD